MKVFELMPNDNRKSFYGKALVYEADDGTKTLRSYQTAVCRVTPDDVFHRMWGGYSATTMRHINAFLRLYGIPGGGKAWWDKIDCE